MKLSVPSTIIIGYALLGIILVIGAHFIGESIWITLTAVGTVGALLFIAYQSFTMNRNLRLQREEFDLEKRPYLYVHLATVQFKGGKDGESWYAGGELVYRNEGNYPASDIKTEFAVHDDVRGKIPLKEWFEEYIGEMPRVINVFPKQQTDQIPLHPSISGDAKLVYISVVVTYSGTRKDTRYWYKYSAYLPVTMKGARPSKPIPLKVDADWDRNINFALPKTEEPDFNKYLDKPYLQ